jgi:hypothetical protein
MADVKAVQVFIDNHHKKCVAALQQIAQLADTGSELHKQRFQSDGESDGIPVSWRVVEAMREIAVDAIGGVAEKQQ